MRKRACGAPDTDSDPTVQTRFGLSNKFSGISAKTMNFFLENDNALVWWERNHLLNKPQRLVPEPIDHTYGYSNSGWMIGGTLHKLAKLDPLTLVVPAPLVVPLRGVTMPEEAMAFVSQTGSLPAGRTPTNLGFPSGWRLDMDTRDFGDEHSAEWIWPLQRTFGVWRELLYAFDIVPNPLP